MKLYLFTPDLFLRGVRKESKEDREDGLAC